MHDSTTVFQLKGGNRSNHARSAGVSGVFLNRGARELSAEVRKFKTSLSEKERKAQNFISAMPYILYPLLLLVSFATSDSITTSTDGVVSRELDDRLLTILYPPNERYLLLLDCT